MSKELTFREVIANIKEGEVWEGPYAPINYIRLREDGVLDFNSNEGVNLKCKYTLQRKEYTFKEAFKAYEEGKEIETKESGEKFKKIKGIDCYKWQEDDGYIKHIDDEYAFRFIDIRGKWYIND